MISTALKLVAALLGIAVVAILAWCNARGVWSLDEYRNYSAMSESDLPIVQSFRSGELRQGSTTAELLAVAQPEWTKHYGRVVHYYYTPRMCFEGMQIVAVDGRLAAARCGSCTWQWEFFQAVPEHLGLAVANVDYFQSLQERHPNLTAGLEPQLIEACNTLQMPVPGWASRSDETPQEDLPVMPANAGI